MMGSFNTRRLIPKLFSAIILFPRINNFFIFHNMGKKDQTQIQNFLHNLSLQSSSFIHLLRIKGHLVQNSQLFQNSNAPTLDLNATYALHSFSYLFYVFFSLRHIRQPSSSPITNRLQTTITYTHIYICVCVCYIDHSKTKKKKKSRTTL